MIDTHCHLTYDPLAQQVEEVLERAEQAGVDRMITVGTSPEDAYQAVVLAKRYEAVSATVGIHPHYADRWTDRAMIVQTMREMAAGSMIVALGEMGLDRYYPDPPFGVQRRAFSWQLEVAAELDRQGGFTGAIIIHNRQATADVVAMIRDCGIDGGRFVFHCFTGNDDELDAVLELGAMVSFTGIVTFKSARELAHSATRVPLDRLMIETDAPYLTPEPHRKVRPNEPCFVPYVARFLAGQRGVDEAVFITSVDANAERFFGLSR